MEPEPVRKHSLKFTLKVFNGFSFIAVGLIALAGSILLFAHASPHLAAGLNVRFLIILQYALYMLVGLRFMQWLHSFMISAKQDEKAAIGFDARWAYLGFGTPWLNLVVPYRIIVGLLAEEPSVLDYQADSNIKLVARIWWALHVIYFFFVPVVLLSLYFDFVTDITSDQEAAFLAFGSIVVLGVSRCAHALVSHLESNRGNTEA